MDAHYYFRAVFISLGGEFELGQWKNSYDEARADIVEDEPRNWFVEVEKDFRGPRKRAFDGDA